MSSPLGNIIVTSSGEAITGLYTQENTNYLQAKEGGFNPTPFQDAIKQLNEYFSGARRNFELLIAIKGTEFQQTVWKELCKIDYGQTTSYGSLAASLGKPNATRAIGSANGRNPICIIIHCHRVIGLNGNLRGYNGGIKIKQWLLAHEANSLRRES